MWSVCRPATWPIVPAKSSSSEFRRNGVNGSIDAFYGACGAGKDDALWVERGRRVRIWN
jgi:predicted metalloendopeptidase